MHVQQLLALRPIRRVLLCVEVVGSENGATFEEASVQSEVQLRVLGQRGRCIGDTIHPLGHVFEPVLVFVVAYNLGQRLGAAVPGGQMQQAVSCVNGSR